MSNTQGLKHRPTQLGRKAFQLRDLERKAVKGLRCPELGPRAHT